MKNYNGKKNFFRIAKNEKNRPFLCYRGQCSYSGAKKLLTANY